MKNGVTLIGVGGHAKVIKDNLASNGFSVKEVFDDAVKSWLTFKEIKAIPRNQAIINKFIVAIGDNAVRRRVVREIIGIGALAIHQSAIISESSKIGEGSSVMAGAIIQHSVIIGRHCIINTAATVDHDCELGNFVHVSPNATLCGGISVGEGTQIGAGAVIIPGISIGKWSVIGAGAVIVKDVPDGATVVGNPGKVIKTKEVNE